LKKCIDQWYFIHSQRWTTIPAMSKILLSS
jgi:hypothetical protein